eukprot:Rmarinus@m.20501
MEEDAQDQVREVVQAHIIGDVSDVPAGTDLSREHTVGASQMVYIVDKVVSGAVGDMPTVQPPSPEEVCDVVQYMRDEQDLQFFANMLAYFDLNDAACVSSGETVYVPVNDAVEKMFEDDSSLYEKDDAVKAIVELHLTASPGDVIVRPADVISSTSLDGNVTVVKIKKVIRPGNSSRRRSRRRRLLQAEEIPSPISTEHERPPCHPLEFLSERQLFYFIGLLDFFGLIDDACKTSVMVAPSDQAWQDFFMRRPKLMTDKERDQVREVVESHLFSNNSDIPKDVDLSLEHAVGTSQTVYLVSKVVSTVVVDMPTVQPPSPEETCDVVEYMRSDDDLLFFANLIAYFNLVDEACVSSGEIVYVPVTDALEKMFENDPSLYENEDALKMIVELHLTSPGDAVESKADVESSKILDSGAIVVRLRNTLQPESRIQNRRLLQAPASQPRENCNSLSFVEKARMHYFLRLIEYFSLVDEACEASVIFVPKNSVLDRYFNERPSLTEEDEETLETVKDLVREHLTADFRDRLLRRVDVSEQYDVGNGQKVVILDEVLGGRRIRVRKQSYEPDVLYAVRNEAVDALLQSQPELNTDAALKAIIQTHIEATPNSEILSGVDVSDSHDVGSGKRVVVLDHWIGVDLVLDSLQLFQEAEVTATAHTETGAPPPPPEGHITAPPLTDPPPKEGYCEELSYMVTRDELKFFVNMIEFFYLEKEACLVPKKAIFVPTADVLQQMFVKRPQLMMEEEKAKDILRLHFQTSLESPLVQTVPVVEQVKVGNTTVVIISGVLGENDLNIPIVMDIDQKQEEPVEAPKNVVVCASLAFVQPREDLKLFLRMLEYHSLTDAACKAKVVFAPTESAIKAAFQEYPDFDKYTKEVLSLHFDVPMESPLLAGIDISNMNDAGDNRTVVVIDAVLGVDSISSIQSAPSSQITGTTSNQGQGNLQSYPQGVPLPQNGLPQQQHSATQQYPSVQQYPPAQ